MIGALPGPTPGLAPHERHRMYPDRTEPAPRTVGLSPKTIVGTVVAGLLGTLVAVLNLVQDDPALLGSLPAPLQTVLIVLVPPVLAGLAVYRASPGTVR